MKKALSRGKHIHFYPEGALEEYCAELRPFKKGAFHLAVEKNVPVIPLVITYRKPRGLLRLFRKAPCFSIEIGKPIRSNRCNDPKAETENMLNRTFDAMLRMMGGRRPDKGSDLIRDDETISA